MSADALASGNSRPISVASHAAQFRNMYSLGWRQPSCMAFSMNRPPMAAVSMPPSCPACSAKYFQKVAGIQLTSSSNCCILPFQVRRCAVPPPSDRAGADCGPPVSTRPVTMVMRACCWSADQNSAARILETKAEVSVAPAKYHPWHSLVYCWYCSSAWKH